MNEVSSSSHHQLDHNEVEPRRSNMAKLSKHSGLIF
jgi:hypothetical protein